MKEIEELIYRLQWPKENDLSNNVECFTIREIADKIKALSLIENSDLRILKWGYKIIETIYGVKYPNQKEKN